MYFSIFYQAFFCFTCYLWFIHPQSRIDHYNLLLQIQFLQRKNSHKMLIVSIEE